MVRSETDSEQLNVLLSTQHGGSALSRHVHIPFRRSERESNWSWRKTNPEGYRKFYSVELYNLSITADIIKEFKLWSLRWVESIARMGQLRNSYKTSVENN
jgi:hypothetical protein